MKILYIEWASFGNDDMKDAFLKEGHELVLFPFNNKNDVREDTETANRLTESLHINAPDLVFSFNYFPVISTVCNKEHIRYISWIYDSPYVMLYSYTAINPCNTIYVFDKELCMEFQQAGIKTVQYLPMAANTERLDLLVQDKFDYDISFVGSLYTEKHNFFERMTGLSDYAKGYLDALMSAQMGIQGYNFIQSSLGPIMNDLYKALPMEPNPDGVETKEYLYAQYVINRKITGLERTSLIQAITKEYTMDLFTHDQSFTMKNLVNHGSVDNVNEMPVVFHNSRINLNISLRSILSGIPQRAFDIMGSGGFLLSNYQTDFDDYFISGLDYDYYENEADLLAKIAYYLNHEEERIAMAKNGHDKIAGAHTYRHRVRQMLDEC